MDTDTIVMDTDTILMGTSGKWADVLSHCATEAAKTKIQKHVSQKYKAICKYYIYYVAIIVLSPCS